MFAQISCGHSNTAFPDEQLEDLQPCFLRQRRKGANCLCCFHISNIMEISIKVKLTGKARVSRQDRAKHSVTPTKPEAAWRRRDKNRSTHGVDPTIFGTVMLLLSC